MGLQNHIVGVHDRAMRNHITSGPTEPDSQQNSVSIDARAIIRDRLTLDVPTAAKVLGIGRRQAYEAAREGTIPTLRLGKRILVPVPKLLAMLGE